MPPTIRYCIQCGRRIDDAATCPSPECGNIPNFYRHVPPRAETAGARMLSGETVADRLSDARAQTPPPVLPPELLVDPNRQTVPVFAKPIAILCGVNPPHQQYPIYPGTTVIGARYPAKIIIDHPEISSRHAEIECQQNAKGIWEVFLSDRDSTNGTFLRGEKIVRCPLEEGDRVAFASPSHEFELRFLADDQERVTMILGS